MVTASRPARTGTVTESLTERSPLNLFNLTQAATRGALDHVTARLKGSDLGKGYLSTMPPGMMERIALIAVQAVAEAIAAQRRPTAPPLAHCLAVAIEMAEGRRERPRPIHAGPGCDDCGWTGTVLNAEDREVAPCHVCGSALVVGQDGGARPAVPAGRQS